MVDLMRGQYHSNHIYATDFSGKICTKCGAAKEFSEFYDVKARPGTYSSHCKACINNQLPEQRARRNTNMRDRALRRIYGISTEQKQQLIAEQGGACLICKKHEKLFVDHDHKTGEVRGLLCTRCNVGIGMLDDSIDNLQSAISYLSRQKVMRMAA